MRVTRRDLLGDGMRLGAGFGVTGLALRPVGSVVGQRTPGQAEGTAVAGVEELGSLAAFLGRLPGWEALTLDENPAYEMYADLAGRYQELGMSTPQSLADLEQLPMVPVLDGLALPNVIGRFWLDAEVAELLGYSLAEVDQAFQGLAPPLSITMLRGRFDRDRIVLAWEEQGYRLLEGRGGQIWSLHEDAAVDLDSEVGRIALSSYNNATWLEDGTLVYGSTLETVQLVLAAVAEGGETLGNSPEIRAMLAARPVDEPLLSGIVVPGVFLERPDFANRDREDLATAVAESLEEFSALPPIALALLGVVSGGDLELRSAEEGAEEATPEAGLGLPQLSVVVVFGGDADLDEAAAAIEERLESMVSFASARPYHDLFSEAVVRVVEDAEAVVVELRSRRASILFSMFAQSDLGFLWWG